MTLVMQEIMRIDIPCNTGYQHRYQIRTIKSGEFFVVTSGNSTAKGT